MYSIHICISVSRTLQNFCLLACTYSSRDSICSPTCVCVCARVCARTRAAKTSARQPKSISINLSNYVCLSVCLFFYPSMYVFVQTAMIMTSLSLCMYVHIYVYMYIYIYMYVYIYVIYIYCKLSRLM